MLRKKPDFDKMKKEAVDKKIVRLNMLGEEIISKIVSRTQRGVDMDNKPFDAYAKSTKRQKTRQGKNHIVNLQDTTKMLRSIKSKRIKDGIRLFFQGSRKGGLSNNDVAYYNHVKMGRKFFGLDKQLKEFIKKTIAKIR